MICATKADKITMLLAQIEIIGEEFSDKDISDIATVIYRRLDIMEKEERQCTDTER